MRIKLTQNPLKTKENLLSGKSLVYAVRIANATLNSHLNSYLAEAIVLILEYAQLMSQAILLCPSYGDHPIMKGVIYAAKLVNPSYLLSFDEERDLTATVMRIIFSWLIVKYCLGICWFYKVFMGKKVSPILGRTFQFFHHTQSRVVYYFVSSFFFRSIIAQKESGFTFLACGKIGDLIVCIVVILFEFVLGIASKISLFYVLPTKSLLSSKDNAVETTTFLQKLIIQLFQVCLLETATATRWIITLTNFLLTVLRAFQYFNGLPLYSIKGLLLQGSLVSLVASLHFSSLIHLILASAGIVHEDLKFLLFSWIILGLISIQLSRNFIKRLILKVLTQNNFSCELLVHKIEMIKQYSKRIKLGTKLTEKNDWFYLLMTSLRKNNDLVFDFASEVDFLEKSERTKFFVAYLEKLSTKHPENKFVKLYLAFYSAKKLRNYARAIALIHESQKELGSRLYLNASVLLSEIKADLKSNYTARRSQFNLHIFAQSQKSMKKLKEAMTRQVDLQFLVCQELLTSTPDLNKIFMDAQFAHKYKQQAVKRMKKIIALIPQYHVSPLMLCAYYNLLINQSPIEYQKLCKVYNLRTQKYQRYFSKEGLCEENLYEGGSALFIISGLRGEIGKVIDCNSSVKRVCGGDPKFYVGSKVYMKICSPSIRPTGENFYRSLAEPEALALYDKTLRSFFFNQEGYIFDSDFYVNTYPSVTHGFLIALFIRPKLENRDFIIVRENGEIEGASRKICKRLGISQPERIGKKKKFHINQICSELGRVNEAMNTVSSVEKDKIKYDVSINIKSQIKENTERAAIQNFEIEEAKYLYSLYTEIGNEVCLTSVNQEDTYNYVCKASNLIYDSCILKVFNLQEVENDKQSELNVDDGSKGKESTIESQDTDCDIEEEEKDQGWIDFDILESKRCQNKLPYCQDIERKTKSEFQTGSSKGKSIRISKLRKDSDTDRIQKQGDTTERDRLVPIPVPVKIAESVANSTSSRRSNARGMFEAMKLALETKNNSKYFMGSFLFFLVLMIFMITIVAVLGINLDKAIQSLGFKKNIMNSAQIRGFDIINIQTTTRAIYDVMNGRVPLEEYGQVGVSLEKFINVAGGFFEELTITNKNLLDSTILLNEDSKRIFYVQNVEIIDSGSTQIMNNFQAVDTLIQAGLQMVYLARTNQTISLDLFKFLNINLMNDVLVKNYQISELTVSSVQSEVDYLQSLNVTYETCVLVATGVICSVLCLIMWLLYKGEKNNLSQLTKLNRPSIESMLEQYNSFRENLLQNDQIPTSISRGGGVFTLAGVRPMNKMYFSSPNTSELQRRFFFSGLKTLILPLLLAAALLFSMVFTPYAMDYLNKKLNQMSFMNQVAVKCSFLTTSTIELAIGNGTYHVWNLPILPATNFMMRYLSEDRSKLFTSFLSEDLLENKEISQLLFGDGCPLIGTSLQLYCKILNRKAVNSSLTQMLGTFETLLIERTSDYENSDKSEEALRKNRLLNYELLFAMKRAISGSSLLVSALLGKEFENKLEELNVRKVLGVCCGLGSLLVIFGMLWILVLKPIQESDNNFKKVLQIFPARIILSNFALKLFLIKTSSLDINLKATLD